MHWCPRCNRHTAALKPHPTDPSKPAVCGFCHAQLAAEPVPVASLNDLRARYRAKDKP